jgi:hypothetical protein
MNHFRQHGLEYRCLSLKPLNMDFNRLAEQLFCNPWTLFACKLTIGLVSACDVHLTIKYVDYLPMMELNPVGRWLMQLDNGPTCELKDVACFLTAKFAGNFVALSVIELLASWKRYIATAVAFPVALCQLALLYFLLFVEH